ncbi:MAG: hypothetical protein ACFFFB_01970 [Candidatus Heimdallarchaeota archaeon]
MSLEKWLKPEKKDERSEAKQFKTEQKKGKNNFNSGAEPKGNLELVDSPIISLSKFKLECPKSTCKYKKTIIKKNLIDKDKICPRCKSIMKIK